MDPDSTVETPHRRPGRLRAAWLALQGAPVVPDAIRAEWTAWQWELEGLCEKVSLACKRVYARDKADLDKAMKRIAELEAGCGADALVDGPAPSARWAQKGELARRWAALKGDVLPELPVPPPTNGDSHEHGPEAE